MPAPLAQSFTLAAVWADLARLTGEPLPAPIAAVVDAALDQVCAPLPVPGPYADHARASLSAD